MSEEDEIKLLSSAAKKRKDSLSSMKMRAELISLIKRKLSWNTEFLFT